ncbi:MAG: hypothetical protein H2038_13475 [Brevundimonas sp.]|uniref:hypothetical protein n=1 Tax=Brevundimonas sp. TaxID=1871086 RepID=UPI0017B54514|nr:hypothetical protein [Brevundimonas sp.]MBA4805654.1 hypothetical protein [Brevundimonas sp.]
MQNPFRQHRPQDDFGRRDDHPQGRWEARDQRWDERASWSEGDGGRTAEAFSGQEPSYGQEREMSGPRGMGYGQHQQSRYGGGMSTGWTGDRQPQQGGSHDAYGYGAQASGPQPQEWGRAQSYGRGDAGSWSGPSGHGGGSMGGQERWSQGGGQGSWSQPGYSQGGDYGGASMGGASGARGGFAGGAHMHGGHGHSHSHSHGGAPSGYPSHGYAPGAQIWEGSGRGMGGQTHEHHDFEPDYLHWREQQLSAFDDDYRSWRDERRQKFSSDFSSWRQNRPRSEAGGEHHTPAENPIVGDVSDGGVGDATEAKKRQ